MLVCAGWCEAQASDDPPALDSSPLEMVLQGVEEQDKVDQVVASCCGLGLTVAALPVSSVGEAAAGGGVG